MKRTLRLIKANKLFILFLLVGISISVTSLYYASTIYVNSVDVKYNNSSSGMSATNTQGAIDELYKKANRDEIVELLAASDDNNAPGVSPLYTFTSTCTASSYPCDNFEINYDYSTTGNFEFAFDYTVYIRTSAQMCFGGIDLLMQTSVTDRARLKIYVTDAWENQFKVRTNIYRDYEDANTNTLMYQYDATNQATGTGRVVKYRIVRRGTTYHIYRDGEEVTTYSAGTTSFSINKIKLYYGRYGSNPLCIMQFSNIYLGTIRSS